MLLISLLPAGAFFLAIYMMGGGLLQCLAVFLAMLLQAGVSVGVFYFLLSRKKTGADAGSEAGSEKGDSGGKDYPLSGLREPADGLESQGQDLNLNKDGPSPSSGNLGLKDPFSSEFVLHRASGAEERLQQVMPTGNRRGIRREEVIGGKSLSRDGNYFACNDSQSRVFVSDGNDPADPGRRGGAALLDGNGAAGTDGKSVVGGLNERNAIDTDRKAIALDWTGNGTADTGRKAVNVGLDGNYSADYDIFVSEDDDFDL